MKTHHTASRAACIRKILLSLASSAALVGASGHAHAAGNGAVAQRAADLKVAAIPVEGMACVSCAATVKRAVKGIDGVTDAEVMLAKRSVKVTYAPSRVSPDRVASVINSLGYKAGVPAIAQ